MSRRLARAAGIALGGYLGYALAGGVLAYWFPKKAAPALPPDAFRGDGEGVDRMLLVEEPRAGFARRIEVMRAARETRDLCCHCAKAGESVEAFFGELIRAADRGVRVRVLFDGKVGGLKEEHRAIPAALLSHPNIRFRLYNPVDPLRPGRWNALLHDKFLVADDRLMLLGGRNLGDEYCDPPGYAGPVTYDRDVLVENTAAGTLRGGESAVLQVKGYMDALWSARETAVPPAADPARGRAAQRRLRQIAARWEARWPEYYRPARPAGEETLPTNRVTLVTNPVVPGPKPPVLGTTLAALLKGGRQVDIQTPYATANPRLLEELRQIAGGAQRARLLTNSAYSSPNFPAFSGYEYAKGAFLDTGFALWEYQRADSIHGKACTVDGRIAAVGSFNLDDRSFYIDTETALVVDSPAFCRALQGEFERLFAQCAQVGPDGGYLPGPVEPVPVPPKKRATMALVSLFSRAVRPLI